MIQGRISLRDHAGWFRICGWGLRVEDHRLNRPLLSERYNGQFGRAKRRYFHIGPWCLLFLRPRRYP